MKTIIVEAPIEKVLDNPFRDFKNYPIDQTQVDRLVASFQDTGPEGYGLWHTLPARLGPEKGTYEQVIGHHRKVAAKKLGYKTIRLEVSEHDDDQMILMMATENGTQRVNNAAASLDSVAAITRRLAYGLLRWPFNQAPAWFRTIVRNQDAHNRAKGNLINGTGIGRDLIIAYAPAGSLERREVDSSIDTLKKDGAYQRIIEYVTERVQQELEIEEAERLRIEQLTREAEERRLKAEQEAAERAERKAEADAARERKRQAEEARKAEEAEHRRQEAAARAEREAEAKAKREKEEAERREREAAAELARLETEREQREREQRQRELDREAYEAERDRIREEKRQEAERRERELMDLAIKAAEAEPLLDGRVVPYFRNHYALSRFREIVTDPNNRHWFPIEQQLDHVKQIHELFEKQNRKPAAENLTANYVGSYLNGYLREALRGKREDERRQRSLDQSFDVALSKALKGASWIAGAVVDMLKLIEDGASLPEDFEAQLRAVEERTTDQLARLRKETGYKRGGKEIAGKAVPTRPRLAISNR